MWWFCPRNCDYCRDPECGLDACRHVAAPMLVPCEGCGALHEPAAYPPVCYVCVLTIERTEA